MAAHPASYFSADYASARAKFQSAASEARIAVRPIVLAGHKGPNGEELAMDVAVLGPERAKGAIVLISATHGVEGFCGSGCQTGLLRLGQLQEHARRLKVVIIHAHNPYGFAWLRRTNEDNVDLNRNYVDHTLPYPENPDYELLKDAIAPSAIEGEAYERANAMLRAYAEKHGAFELQAAMTRGQYRHADGLYYGGKEATWSNKRLTAALERNLAHQTHVGVIDFHTGLGPFGHGEIINEYEPGSPCDQLLARWFGGEVKSTRLGDSVSAELTGTFDGAIPRILPWARTASFALEFGTVSTSEVIAATRADNWLHLHSNPLLPVGKKIKAEIRRVFYPDTDDWKELVFTRALEVTARTAQGVFEAAERM